MNRSTIIAACLIYNLGLFGLAFWVTAVYDWSLWTFAIPMLLGLGMSDIQELSKPERSDG